MQQSLEQQQTATTIEKNRGRVETRTVTTTTATIDEGYLDWPGAQQLIRLKRHTQLANGTTRESTTYAITSLSRTTANAELLLDRSRGRWHIENRGFHVLGACPCNLMLAVLTGVSPSLLRDRAGGEPD